LVRQQVLLTNIFESITKIEEYIHNLSQIEFLQNDLIQDAVIWRLEVIGETVKNLSEDFRAKHPDVPWQRFVGLRDALLESYFEVNLGQVLLMAKEDLPSLKDKVAQVLKEV
jgi:uncharacterized protein with HEPN domain